MQESKQDVTEVVSFVKKTVGKYTISISSPHNPCPAEPGYTVFANCVDPDQLASEEVN